MATDIRIIAGGVTNFLLNSSGTPTPGGVPTAAATTPFSILNEDWVMQSSIPTSAYTGGPPFADGALLAYQAYPNTVQVIPITVEGSSYNNMVSLLQGLRRLINQTLMLLPAVLYYKPNGSTNELYYEIESGYLQEKPGRLNPSAGFNYAEAELSLVLKPFGVRLSPAESLISAVSFRNTGTGSPDNIQVYSAGSGDLVFEGSPLNISITPAAGSTTYEKVYLATIKARTYSALSGVPIVVSLAPASPVSLGSMTFNVTDFLTNSGLRCRVVGRFNAAGSPVQYRIVVSNAGDIFYTSPFFNSPQAGNPAYIDFGPVPLNYLKRYPGVTAPQITIGFEAWKTSIGSGGFNVTPLSAEAISYYTWCTLQDGGIASAGSSTPIVVASFAEQSGSALTTFPPSAIIRSGTDINAVTTIRGSVPFYVSGSSLYLAWTNSSGVHVNTENATVTVTHSPQYFTMRGSG